MFIKVAMSFPTTSAREMGKRLLDGGFIPPEYMEVLGPYYFVFMHEGFRSFTIFKFDDEKAGPALAWIRKYPQRYFGVSGFTYAVEIGSTHPEKLEILGVE
jgi:hypothetical protein